MSTFTVNGGLAHLATLASNFAEFRLQMYGGDYHNAPGFLLQRADGSVAPLALPVNGVEIDAAREALYEMIFSDDTEIERAVFFSEAWTRAFTQAPDAVRDLSGDPERQEVLVLDGRDRAGNRLIACRDIVRGDEPHLGEVRYNNPDRARYVPSTTG